MFFIHRRSLIPRFALIMILLIGVVGAAPAQAQSVVYRVSPDGAVSGLCGRNWSTPCDLQYLLSQLTSGGEVWVKEGIYKPGTDRSSTFSLMGGIAIYGGFAGVETSRDQRDPSAHLTVLSGDLNGDDNGNIASDEPARAENAFHVVSSGGNGNTAILDGFTISGGNANLDSGTHTARGGGMWNGNGSPTLTNVTFAGNTSLELGGGMFNENNSRPTLTNVSFLNNSSEGGGGLANHRSTPILTNVVFVNNNASYSGGGALNLSESHATFTNVTFTGNSAFSFGGGMSSYDSNPSVLSSTFVYNTAFGNDHPFHTYDQTPPFGGGMYNYHSNTVIVNSTFSNNRAESERDPIAGSGMGNQESDPILTHVTISEDRDGIVNDASHPVVRNSIIWVNSFLVGAIAIVDANNSNSVVSDSVIWNGFPGGTNIIIADPLLGELGNYGGHTQMVPLQPGSSAIDTGSSSDCPVTDQRNVARPQGGGCDIGAFEYTEGPSVTVTPSPVTPITSVTSTLTPNPTPTATYTLIPTLAFTPTPISSGGTAVVSANTGGALGNGESLKPFISADGRYVTFYSEATNLVSGDTTQNTDVFLRDNLTGIMERVSVSSSGIQGNSSSYSPSVSADGRYVVFGSISYTLVPGDTNSSADIFIRDRQTGLTECVSVTTSGVPGNGISSDPAISANGRYVAFSSSARNLVVGDTTVASDIFVRDIQTETTTRVSVGSNGTEANSASYGPSISADGRYVAFESYATNLVQDDTNGTMDIFVHDRETGITTRVSVDSNAVEANSSSINPSISANGRYVVFSSLATNLVSGDTNGETGSDIFIHDMQTGVTKRVSVDSNGAQANGGSHNPSISGDGQYVVFDSTASNLVTGDFGQSDVFVHDMQTGTTTRVTVDENGGQANGGSMYPAISDDGSYVVYHSGATNLVQGDKNLVTDIFIHRQNTPVPPTSTPTATVSPTLTPSYTPTLIPTETLTPTPSSTPTVSSTPILSCDAVNHGPLILFGNTMSLIIMNPTGFPLAVQDVLVAWNHDMGHSIGNDKSLILQDASLNGVSFWSGSQYGPSLTIRPLNLFIPPGDSTIVFTFHQTYDRWDNSEELLINWGTNGCQSYPIHALYEPPTHTPTATPPYSYSPLYLSLTGSQAIGGVTSSDEDILRFDGQNWSLLFDGSDVGVGSPDLFAFSIVDGDTILMSFNANVTVNGITASPQDVLRFDATSLGGTTSGTWSLYFDGSDVGFDTSSENIDSLTLLPDGRLLISTTGNPSVPGLTTGRDEDVLAFTPTSLGNTTSGIWSLYFDGSDVGLGETNDEDVDALDVTANGNVYLSTLGNFAASGISGADEDVFVCVPTSIGDVTSCNYSSALYFDGSTWGLSANDVDAFNFLAPGSIPTTVPTNTGTSTPTRTPTRTPSPTNTPTATTTATVGVGSTLTFTAVADARVVQTSPTTNYGTATTLQADGDSGAAQTSYIRFTTNGISGLIQSVKLRVFCTTNGTVNGPAAHLADSNWIESGASGINWNTQPALSSSTFDNKGAIAANSWVEYDVTALVNGNGTYTFALVADSSDGIVFSSREGTMPPQLVVTLESGPSTSTPSQTNLPSMTNTPTATLSPTLVSATPTFTPTQIIVSSATPTHTYTATPINTSSATAVSSTFTFSSLADTYVNAGSPTTNYGSSTALRVDASPDLHSYLRFNVQGLNGTVTRATLRVFANSASTQGCTAHRVSNNSWTESALNYNNAPVVEGTLGASGPFGAGVWISMDVTAYVTGNGTYDLAVTTPGSTAVSLASRESGANAPQLIIETAP